MRKREPKTGAVDEPIPAPPGKLQTASVLGSCSTCEGTLLLGSANTTSGKTVCLECYLNAAGSTGLLELED